MDIGTINTITLNDDRLECVVDFGADDVDPLCIVNCGANRNEYPMVGDEVVVDRDGAESSIIAVFRPHPAGLATGESIFYGRDGDGNAVSTVKVCADGQVQINGGGRSVAAYPDLETAFNTFKQDFNTHINIFTNHTHPYVDTPIGAAVTVITTTPGTPTTADITPSESDTVEVP